MNRQQRRAEMRAQVKKPTATWTPFVQTAVGVAGLNSEGITTTAAHLGVAPDVIYRQAAETFAEAKWYRNNLFLVGVRPAEQPDGWLHLLVKRCDDSLAIGWPDLQRIKDEIVGPECEAVELFPANARLIHMGDTRHMWANPDPNDRLHVGMHVGRHVAS
jgi:hypothetical protein